MMRNDGGATFYLVQHQYPNNGEWVQSALGHFLFDGLTYDESRGEPGETYRDLLSHEGASTDLWQRYGINGFERVEDASEACSAVRARHPDRLFRVVRRSITQHTQEVPE